MVKLGKADGIAGKPLTSILEEHESDMRLTLKSRRLLGSDFSRGHSEVRPNDQNLCSP